MSDGARATGHSIGAVESRTGLSRHTLRAWERRYGAVEPARSDGGHRLYTEAQVRRLRLLQRLTELGHRIGNIATLPSDDLDDLLTATREDAATAPAGADGGGTATRERVRELMEAIRQLDGDRLEAAFRRAALQGTVHGLIQDVITPLLDRVGRAWERGEISPAQEHLASGIVMRTLGWVLETCEPEDGAPGIVVATPSGQQHNLGAMLAAATAAAAGWRVSYLGGDLPGEEIGRAARSVDARAVGVSVVYPREEGFLEELRALRAAAPDDAVVLVGGAAAEERAEELAGDGLQLLSDYEELRRALEEIRA